MFCIHFGLTSVVCSQIVGMHSCSGQVTYDLWMDADLCSSFFTVSIHQ